MRVDVQCKVCDSFRVRQVAGMFDVPLAETLSESFECELPAADEPWQIGLIVGPSASGKTTIARAAFGDALYTPGAWPADRAVIDACGERSIREITGMLTAVGLSSPRAWIKPYARLSGGERFRCDLARALLSDAPLVVFDEFTSLVDRTAARCGAAAVSKALRAGRVAKRLVAVTCHDDVTRWLSPDWTLDLASGKLARGRLRRPRLRLEVVRCRSAAWRLFARHHYLSGALNRAARCYLATWDGAPVAFAALLALPGRRGAWRISRLVVLPDFQGLGIGRALADALAEHYAAEDCSVCITTSHPAMIRALKQSRDWRVRAVRRSGFPLQGGARRGRLRGYIASSSRGRAVVSFVYAPVAVKGESR